MSKVAVITGVNGQDGSYLSELLLSKQYNVVGICRRSSTPKLDNLGLSMGNDNFKIIEGDITDPSSMNSIMKEYRPDEFYNLAAQSHVATSFSQPSHTFDVNAMGVLNILEAIKNISPETKVYQASTSELFGSNFDIRYKEVTGGPGYLEKYQDEKTQFGPNSPYAVAKLAAHNLVRIYREGYGIKGCCGILFNHESPRRGENFVTRKITKWIGKFVASKCDINISKKLKLGNINSVRDWGYAKDYVRAMWMMLQQDTMQDYVISTGECHSIKDFLKIAFESSSFLESFSYEDMIEIDPSLYRPSEVEHLNGCSGRANKQLGWKPIIKFEELVREMVQNDVFKK